MHPKGAEPNQNVAADSGTQTIRLTYVAGVWERFSLDQKQRLQEVLFPQGIEYQDGVYRTQEMSFLFKGLEDVQGIDERFGSATGNRTRV